MTPGLVSATLITGLLTAAPPTSEQVKAVFDHYYAGQGRGAVLVDTLLCRDIEKAKKETKYDCVATFEGSAKVGDDVNVYLVLLVPEGDTEELMVQAAHEGVVRETRDVSVTGRVPRSRTWKSFKLSKPGKWEFVVRRGTVELIRKSIQAEP
jgi:hypothetical protein